MTGKLEIITSWWEEVENRFTDERVKRARAKKVHKLGFKTERILRVSGRGMFPKVQINLKEVKEKTAGKKENKEKFLQQYSSQRTIIETAQEHPQKRNQTKGVPR